MQSEAAIFVSEPTLALGCGDGDANGDAEAFGLPFDPAEPAGGDPPEPLHDATNDEASATKAYRRILKHFLLGRAL